MAWYRAGGGGIPAALKTGMNDVLNKKFGTSTTYAPNTWPDNVNLLGKLPEKTVSGAIAHITDGADRVPIKNWQVTLGASLTGVSSLTCKQAKKNICTVLPWARDTHFWGSSWSEMVTFLNTLPPGNYSVSYDFEITAVIGDSIDVSYAPYIRANVDGTMVNITPYSTPLTDSAPTVGKTYHCQSIFGLTAATVGKVAYFYLYCGKTGAKVAEVTVKNAQIELDSAPTTYETPEITTNTVNLGRTIYGGSVDVVAGTGTDYGLWVNMSDIAWTEDATRAGVFYGTVTGRKTATASEPSPVIGCTCYDVNNVNVTTGIDKYISGARSYGGTIIFFRDSAFSGYTRAQVQEALQGEKVCVVSANQTDFTFTPITPTPETSLGINNFWADANSTSEVTYRRDIDLALGGG